MKKLIASLAAALTVAAASAQTFEGTIVWKVNIDITDPAMKQQMDAANAMMGDPATQQQMASAAAAMNDPAVQAQIQAAMNNPQMKAAMDANPAMKSMMAGRMGAMPGAAMGRGNPMANMFPKSMTLKTKAGSSLFSIEGGAATESLSIAGKPESIQLDRAARTYHTLPAPAATTQPAATYKINKTSETATILGYKTQKYVVDITSGADKGMSYAIWTTNDIKGAQGNVMSRMQIGRGGQANFMGEIDGLPLKMEFSGPQMKMTMEAGAVTKEPLSDDLFKIPAGFTEKK